MQAADRFGIGEEQSDGKVTGAQMERIIAEDGPALPRLEPCMLSDVDVHADTPPPGLTNKAQAS